MNVKEQFDVKKWTKRCIELASWPAIHYCQDVLDVWAREEVIDGEEYQLILDELTRQLTKFWKFVNEG